MNMNPGMNMKHTNRGITRLGVALLTPMVSWAVCWWSPAALAGGTITNCTQADLEAALAGGGTAVFACAGTLTLTSTVAITQSTVLDAGGYNVVIAGGQAVGLFLVANGVTFWVKEATLTGGSVIGANGVNGVGVDGGGATSGGNGAGAGILNLGGTLILTDCTLTNHVAQGGMAGGGDPEIYDMPNGGDGLGGAIYSAGGVVNLTNCILVANAAVGGLGDIPSLWTTGGGTAAGGAVYATASTVTIVNSVFSADSAQGGAGSGFQFTTFPGARSGASQGGCMALDAASSATIISSRFANNLAPGPASFCQFAGVGQGGAIYNDGTLIISDSTFVQNQAPGSSGSPNPYGNAGPPGLPSAGQGGAIYSTGTLILNGCAFANNLVVGGMYGGVGNTQGAPGEGGAVWSSGTLAVTNCTLAANSAIGGSAEALGGAGRGGAILISGGTAMLENVTIATNQAVGGEEQPVTQPSYGPAQGGGLCISGGSATVRGSIVADNAGGGDVWGTVIDGGYNICSDGTAGFSSEGSLNEADPRLAPLANNGGPTATMLLLAGSPAIDAIPLGFPPTDQRGVSRPQGAAADIGALEVVPAAPRLRLGPLEAKVTITFNAEAGRTYRLLWSPNLAGWTSIATTSTAASGSLQFVVPMRIAPSSFYRVVTP